MDITNNLEGGSFSDSEKYKDAYIGHVKVKNGNIKIIPGSKDERILETRDKILGHLHKVFSGGKRLKEKNITKYFKALGGKYIRNDLCITGDNSNCKGGRNVSIDGAHKLLKLINKKNLPINSALETFKGSAPELYEKLETKIKGGYKAISYKSEKKETYPEERRGGYDERKEAYPEERRGGYDERKEAYPEERRGGYDDRKEAYPEERRGGYDDRKESYSEERRGGRREAYPEERRGGYDDRKETLSEERRGGRRDKYYSEERRGGYERKEYYPDEMHGGNLGLFRSEINRNLNTNSLRQSILNINL
jgi:hypothetical protein